MPIVSHPANRQYLDNFDAVFGKKYPPRDDIPRRNRMDLMTPAELACLKAVSEIEVMGCDERLTRAQILIQQAQGLVADFVDSRP